MIQSVPEPEELTEDDRYEMDFHGGNFHEQGKTVHGEVPLGRTGSQWRLVDGERGIGNGFHAIDLLCVSENDEQFFIASQGSGLYIIDSQGRKLYSKFKSVEHVDGRVVKLFYRGDDEGKYVELYPQDHDEYTPIDEL